MTVNEAIDILEGMTNTYDFAPCENKAIDMAVQKLMEENHCCENCKWFGLVEGLNWLACTKHIHVDYNCRYDICALWESKDVKSNN